MIADAGGSGRGVVAAGDRSEWGAGFVTTTESHQGQRWALVVEYDGAPFRGWQRQRNAPSVQAHLEQALSRVAAAPITVKCAGRTDAGVHALAQVVHFDAPYERPERAWTLGVNTILPASIRVVEAHRVPGRFHARFSACGRHYRYLLLNRARPSALAPGRVSHYRTPLELAPMQAAATCLLGRHDFESFRAVVCQADSPIRTLHRVAISRSGALLRFDFHANAFLHHMVRNIVGTLMAVGSGREPVEWVERALQARDRRAAGMTAPPDGLYFVGVDYLEGCGFESLYRLPWWDADAPG